MRRRILLALILVADAAALLRVAVRPDVAEFLAPPSGPAAEGAPRFETRFVSLRPDTQAHAASLIELRDGRLRAFWYAGSREGAEDVSIRSAVFDPASGTWGAEQLVADRAGTQAALRRMVRKLGNPVPARAADGRLWLYFVTVSVGGWAGSSITAIASSDEGETWSPPRRLVTSPFLNVSTLVKGAPFLYVDGTLGLPVYHELMSKFGELLRLDQQGRVVDLQRLSSSGRALQPVVLVRSPTQARVLMRNAAEGSPRRVINVATTDAGRHWSPSADTSLANPDAAIGGVVLPDGRLLVALNDVEKNRDTLSLALSADGGQSWRSVYRLEAQPNPPREAAPYADLVARLAAESDPSAGDGRSSVESVRRQMCGGERCDFEFSYPYLTLTKGGGVELVYTWNRAYIKHVRFNRAWLERRLEDADRAAH